MLTSCTCCLHPIPQLGLSGLTTPSSPAAGFRSATNHEPKRFKDKTGIYKILDQAVGCNELVRPVLPKPEKSGGWEAKVV